MFVSMLRIEKVSDLRKRVRELGKKEMQNETKIEKLGLTFYLIRNQKSNLTRRTSGQNCFCCDKISDKYLFPVEFKMAYVGRTEFTLMSSICQLQKRKTPYY